LLQESGASLKFAQERLGHADASTTANIYTHTVNDRGSEFAKKVEAAFQFGAVGEMLTVPSEEVVHSEKKTVNRVTKIQDTDRHAWCSPSRIANGGG
jgi:hypothetical protein